MSREQHGESENNQEAVDLRLLFDLGPSDGYRNSVRVQTFENQQSALLEIANLVRLDYILTESLFRILPYGHPTTELSTESETDFKASIYLALGGYYRQAIAALRGWLEIILTSIYYNRNDNSPDSPYDRFKQGCERSPGWKSLLNNLFKRDNFATVDKEHDLKQLLEDLYGDLSAFVHRRGFGQHDLQLLRDIPRYDSVSFDLWFSRAKRTSDATVQVLIVEYARQLRQYFSTSSQELASFQKHLPKETVERPLVAEFLASISTEMSSFPIGT